MACKCCEVGQRMNEVALLWLRYLLNGALVLEDKGSPF